MPTSKHPSNPIIPPPNYVKPPSEPVPPPYVISERPVRGVPGAGMIECLLHQSEEGSQARGNAFATVYLGGHGACSLRPEDVRATAQFIVDACRHWAAHLKQQQSE